MKILFVSVGIFPNRGAVSFVTESLAKNFTPEEMAVAGEHMIFYKRIKRTGNIPRFYYSRTNVTWKGRGKRFTLPLRWLIFPLLLLKLQYVVWKERCTYVLATFPDNYYLYGAYLIAKWNKLGFSSYFHNTYLENRTSGVYRRFAEWLQPKVFERSDYIFVMSEGMQHYYEKLYPGNNKFCPLIHTFEDYPPEKKLDLRPKDRYDLILIGNFNPSNIEATGRLVEALKNHPRFNIKMFTHVPKAFLRMRGIDADAIDYRGFVKQEDFYKELQDNDICVLTHGFTGGYTQAEYETIFPTRTINFLVSGLPIFAHSPANSFLNFFLRKWDCAQIVDEPSAEKIVEAMEYLADHPERRQQLVENARRAAEPFYGPNVARFLKEKLEAVKKT